MRADIDDADGRHFRRRLKALALVAFVGLGLLTVRIAWLQVVRHDDYAAKAERNRAAARSMTGPLARPVAQQVAQPPAGAN